MRSLCQKRFLGDGTNPQAAWLWVITFLSFIHHSWGTRWGAVCLLGSPRSCRVCVGGTETTQEVCTPKCYRVQSCGIALPTRRSEEKDGSETGDIYPTGPATSAQPASPVRMPLRAEEKIGEREWMDQVSSYPRCCRRAVACDSFLSCM